MRELPYNSSWSTVPARPRLANLIWQIADLLRGPYRPPQYERVMLPMTVLRRFDCVLASTKPKVLAEYAKRIGERIVANFLYVDNSNVWIEGMHVAAVASGLAPNVWTAQQGKICDQKWKLDSGRLMGFAGGKKEDIGRAVLYGSRPPANDSLWDAAKRKGFEVVVHDRSRFTGREKKVDTNIVTDVIADSYELMDPAKDEITLVSGDADYVPAIERLRKRGFQFDVCFWDHASKEIRQAASNFISLNAHLDHLGR